MTQGPTGPNLLQYLQFLEAWVGAVRQALQIGISKRGDLEGRFSLQIFGDDFQKWSFGFGRHQGINGGHTEGRGFPTVHEDWSQNLLDLVGHQMVQMAEGSNGFQTQINRIKFIDVVDDFGQFEDGQVQTGVVQGLQHQNLRFPIVGLAEFADEQLKV